MAALAPSQNPRNQRTQLKPFIGKKVTLGLANLHYLCGWLEAFEDQTVRVRVSGKAVLINRAEILKVAEAPAAQAEFFK